jgi:O-antigen ligase
MAALIALFLVFSPFRWSWGLAGASEGLILVALLLACGAAIGLGLRVAPGPSALLAAAPVLWSLVGLALLSCLWSALPARSLLRVVGLGAAVLLGYYLHRRLSFLAVLRLILWSMGGVLLLSLLVVLVAPEVGVHQGWLEGAWRGAAAHRNHLGLIVSLVFSAAAMLAVWGTARERPLALLCLPLTAGMLLPVGSATAVVLVVAVSAVVILGRLTDYRPALRLPALLLLAVAPFLAVLCRDALLPLLGRTASLSNRVVIWEHMADVVMRRPLLGYGYGLSWTDVPALQVDLVQHGRHWQAVIHSGYISTAFWLGLLGALLLAVLLVRLLWSSAKRFHEGEPGVQRTLPLALLVLLLLSAFPQDRMLSAASLQTALLALLAFHLREPVARRVPSAGALLVLLCFGFGCKPSGPGVFLGFEEVSGDWGIGDLDARGICIFDLEGDGDQDMLWVRAGGSKLFENQGPGRFVDVSEARGISDFGNSLGCAALDLDRDGDSDLLITDNDGPTLLLRNDGSGHFSDVTAQAGLADQSGQASIAAADADGDGALDLLLSGVQDKTTALLFGDGAGGFEESTSLPLLDTVQRSWAAAWIDIDNDGLPELFVGTDQPARPGFRASRDVLLGNLGGREFGDITEQASIGNSQNAMGLAVADVDQDGFLDLYVTKLATSHSSSTQAMAGSWTHR